MGMLGQVKRREDMSHDGFLSLIIQTDGDVVLTVKSHEDKTPFGQSIEFCLSGGQSPNTFQALRRLYAAMRKDNLKKPQS